MFRQPLVRQVVCLVLLLLLPCSSAFAVLGDNVRSVFSDQARLNGTLQTVAGQSYTLHEIKAAKGTVVREYVAPSGAVFAVGWEGQFAPDLQQVLGAYYQQVQQAAQQQRQQTQRARGHFLVETPELACESFGHQRSLHGRCYLPKMVPAGTPTSEIR
jgi:hypothetical protein